MGHTGDTAGASCVRVCVLGRYNTDIVIGTMLSPCSLNSFSTPEIPIVFVGLSVISAIRMKE